MVRYSTYLGDILVVDAGISHVGLISSLHYSEVDFEIKTKYDMLLSELKSSNKETREFSNFNNER